MQSDQVTARCHRDTGPWSGILPSPSLEEGGLLCGGDRRSGKGTSDHHCTEVRLVPISTGSVVLVTYRSLYAAQRVLLTHTYVVSGDQGIGQPWERSQQLADVLANPLDPVLDQYRRCLPNNVQVGEVRAQIIAPVRYQAGIGVVNLPGLQVQGATTGNIACALTFHTGLAARNQIANKHIGPLPTNTYSDGAPTLLYRDALDTLGSLMAQQFSQNVAGGLIQMDPCIYHRGQGTNTKIITWTVTDRVGTLRRRTLRVGE